MIKDDSLTPETMQSNERSLDAPEASGRNKRNKGRQGKRETTEVWTFVRMNMNTRRKTEENPDAAHHALVPVTSTRCRGSFELG